MELNCLSNREFKVRVIKTNTEVRRAMHKPSETFNRESENSKKYQTEITEVKTIITAMKHTMQGFNNRLD